MANSDKNILITPNTSSSIGNPTITFSGANASVGPQNIYARVYPTSGGTLSFEGSAGQLFSITNSLTGTIFSVNDISGMPSIEVLDTGTVKIAQYSGNVLMGGTTTDGVSKLQVTGSANVSSLRIASYGQVINSSGVWTGPSSGLIGPQGPQGPIGPIGNTGPQGPQGPIGPIGPIGNTGPQGPQGPIGPIGNTGPQGPQGPIGPIGNTGPQGPQGPIGPIGNTGPQGPRGPQGPQGPIGPIGPIGNTGPQGPQGPIGPIGNTGPQGPQGPIGPIGNTGPQGPRGPQGPQGPIGPIGPIGNTGPQGPQGPIGPIGNTGPQGPQGPIGPIGNTGPQGPRGPQGPQGPIGPIGPIGNTGPQGPQGPIGPIGNTGPQGPQGPIGPIGPIGNTGPQGPQGPIGPIGPIGNTGPQGPQGPSGVLYDRTNWSTAALSGVVGQLGWKNYGNNHTIFDASQSTSPQGTAVNNTNPGVNWTGTYPTLMGWNGSSTYGVRVDTCRYADSAGSAPSVTVNYSNDSNSTYQMVWGSGNYLYGTGGIYCNPFTDVLYASGGFNGTATSAKYADLAEQYQSDTVYEPGTVVIFGGDNEITQSTLSHDSAVAGVISTDPGFLMNSELSNNNALPVALQGRVPCKVVGPVRKGDMVVTSFLPGVAQRLDKSQYQIGCVIGKSLETITDGTVKTIEVVVGRV